MACRFWTRWAVVCSVEWLALAGAATALAQPAPPGPIGGFGNLQTVRSFEHACSVSMIDDETDAKCRMAIVIALGKEPIVEEVRTPSGGNTQTARLLPADVPKAGWLGEEACANRHWQACMLYEMLLERGDTLPRDPPHAVELLQVACHGGYARACEGLKEKGVPASANPRPHRPAWVKEPADEPTPRITVAVKQPTPAVAPAAPPQPRTVDLDRPLSPEDPTESEPLERCKSGSAGDCYTVARIYDALPRDAQTSQRARHYYQKACDAGMQRACDRLGVKMPEQARRAVAASRTTSNITMWLILAALVAGLCVLAVVAFRKMRGSPSPAPRPVAVPPPARAAGSNRP